MLNSEKPYIHKRMIAYVIDILIVSIISSLIMSFFPKNDAYEKKYKEFNEIVEKYNNKEIKAAEYNNLVKDINYDLAKENIEMPLVVTIISLLYFVIYAYYFDGVTIGKKIMKLQIVSANNKSLTINNYLLRSLIIDSILYNIVSVMFLVLLSKNNYILYSNKITSIFNLVYILSFAFALYRNDGRGLHDLIASTKVISTNSKILNNDSVKEAKVLNEKQEKNSKKVGSDKDA